MKNSTRFAAGAKLSFLIFHWKIYGWKIHFNTPSGWYKYSFPSKSAPNVSRLCCKMYYKDLEWCLRLSYFFGCHPANKRKILGAVQYVLILSGCVCIPTLTIMMFYYKKEPLTVRHISSVSGNFTFLIHVSIVGVSVHLCAFL